MDRQTKSRILAIPLWEVISGKSTWGALCDITIKITIELGEHEAAKQLEQMDTRDFWNLTLEEVMEKLGLPTP